MSKDRLRDMILEVEGRLEKRLDKHQENYMGGIAELRTDLRIHAEIDRKTHDNLQGQFNKIYSGAVAALVGFIAWVFK